MNATTYPGAKWECMSANRLGLNCSKLYRARRWLDQRIRKGRYRVVVVRGGYLVAEWSHGFARDKKSPLASAASSIGLRFLRFAFRRLGAEWDPHAGRERQLPLASVGKSIFSCLLGIAINEGKLPSADAKIVDYYPEAMGVPEGEGPKAGRYAFPKDHNIIFRQLISNTSGYMKPSEQPGKVFHYQTYGMNILAHAIAKTYGLYEIHDPEGSPGLRQLIDEKLCVPIGANWSYYTMNFDLHPKARIHIFGNYDGVKANALDMARLGWLWRNWGLWEDRQLVPEAWLREATQIAPEIRANCPPSQWKYGYGFWTNYLGRLWPSLPHDSFAASGARCQQIWVCPSLDLVIVQSPGLFEDQKENNSGFLRLVVDSCT